MLHKSALAQHHRFFPQHFHSQRCDSNIIGSVTEPRVQAPESAFPPHPWILYLSPFNLLWSWIGSRSCQTLCTTPMTWQHATPHVKVLKDSAQCKISIPEFTQQARQTATRFLLYAWPGTGGVATACHSGVSIHCCLAAKVLLLLEILETGFSYQKSEKPCRMTGGQCAGKCCAVSIEIRYPFQELEVGFFLKWHKTATLITLLLASPLLESLSDDTASCCNMLTPDPETGVVE